MEPVRLNNRGFTLVEVMIALLVALLVFFALMQTALVGIDANMRNVLRDEAVAIAEMHMNEVRTAPYESIISDTGTLSGYDCPATGFSSGEIEERNVRNIANFDFCTNLTCWELDGGDNDCSTNNLNNTNKRITITIGWKWKGESYYHVISSIIRRIET